MESYGVSPEYPFGLEGLPKIQYEKKVESRLCTGEVDYMYLHDPRRCNPVGSGSTRAFEAQTSGSDYVYPCSRTTIFTGFITVKHEKFFLMVEYCEAVTYLVRSHERCSPIDGFIVLLQVKRHK